MIDVLWPALQLLRGGMYMLWMCSCWRLGIAVKMPCCSRWGSAVLSTKGIVSLISISRPPPLFLWRSCRTAAHPGVLSGLVLLVSFSYFSADSVRIPLHQSYWRGTTWLVRVRSLWRGTTWLVRAGSQWRGATWLVRAGSQWRGATWLVRAGSQWRGTTWLVRAASQWRGATWLVRAGSQWRGTTWLVRARSLWRGAIWLVRARSQWRGAIWLVRARSLKRRYMVG